MSREIMLRNIERAQRAIDENKETVKKGISEKDRTGTIGRTDWV